MKIKVIEQRIVLPSRYSIPDFWSFPEKKEFEIECKGSGTVVDSILLEDTLQNLKRVTFKDQQQFLLGENLRLKKLYLDNCENFTLDSCEFSYFRLNYCSNIIIRNSIISYDFRLKECNNITLENCYIRRMISFKSNDNKLKENYIPYLKDWMSKHNTYNNNYIKRLETNVKLKSFEKRNTLNDNEIKKGKYRLRKLFEMGPKVLFKDKMCWSSIIFLIYFITFLSITAYNQERGVDISFLPIILALSLPLYIFSMYASIYLSEQYFKIKSRIKLK